MKRKVLLGTVCVVTFQLFLQAIQHGYNSGKIEIIKILEITNENLSDENILENPISLDINPDDDIFVCDFKANNIKKFDKNGNYLITIGRPGQGPGDLHWPLKIASLNDRIAVWEVLNRRISLFYSNGEFIKSVKFASETGIPQEIKSISNKYFVIEFEKFSYDDEKFPQELRLDLYNGEMNFIKTLYSKKIFRIKRLLQPRRIDVFQPYNPNIYWDVSLSGRIIIGYSKDYKVEIFDPEKGLLQTFNHNYKPVEISKEDKIKYFAGMNITYIDNNNYMSKEKGTPNFIINNTHFPKVKPAFNSIVYASNNFIWVHSYISDRELEDSFFDAFSTEGKFINKVEIIGDTKFPYNRPRTKIINDTFWQIIPNKNGNRIVTKFLIKNVL